MTDLVNHPSHYKTESGLEVIDMIEQGLEKYDHRDQVLKYVYRAPSKGNYLQDLQKAQWYLNRTIQNVIDGKLKPNEFKLETYESFDLNYNKIAVPESKSSEEESEPVHEYDRSKVYKDSYDCVWEWFEEFETWAWGTSHDDCRVRAEYFNRVPVKYAEPWESEAPYTVAEEVEVKPLNSSTIEDLLNILADTVEPEDKDPEFDKDYIYTDSDGDDWGWVSEHNTWSWGHDPEARSLRATIYADIEDLCAEPKPLFGPFTKQGIAPSAKKESKPKYDKDKVWKDKDGDAWECIEGVWVTGDTHEERVESGHEMLEFGDYYTDLPNDYAPYTEFVAPAVFDENKRYLDRDDDIWAFHDGHWYFGHSHQDLEDKFGMPDYQWNRPCVRIKDCEVVDAPEYNPRKLYKDRDGDVWESIRGLWVFGRDHERRSAKRARGYGNLNLNGEFAPFVEIEDENGETV